MGTDFRREWVKNTVTKFFGLSSDSYFEEMMMNSDDLEDKLAFYLDDNFLEQDDNRQFLFIYKTAHEKLVEEEILVPETGK